MDNITHSFTGALASGLLQKRHGIEREHAERVIFWLFVAAANLPDIDVAAGMFGNQIFALQHHRGITHSILFAPVLALLPAALFRWKSPVKDWRILWTASLVGILIHIMVDYWTAFGTQLLAPFSTQRYALDWMFIIDPWFTLVIGILLFMSRSLFRRRRLLQWSCAAFVVLYVSAAALFHGMASGRFENALEKLPANPRVLAALPQPFNPTRWMGIARVDSGIVIAYFSALGSMPVYPVYLPDDHDQYTKGALATTEGQWYMGFARFPSVLSRQASGGEGHVVEIRDMQFAVDPAILHRFGMTDRASPFTMRFNFAADGGLKGLTFNH